MANNPILGRDVYIALAAVGWADGELTPGAADAIVRTALEEGLELDEIQEIEVATRHRVEIGEIDRMNMSKADRLYVYAVAAWIAFLDGHKSDNEQEALERLGVALKLPEVPRARVDEIVAEMAAEDGRPDRFDLRGLRATLERRHEAARLVRLAGAAVTTGDAEGAEAGGDAEAASTDAED